MKRAIVLLALLAGACGSAPGLQPAAGEALPVAPYGAAATPTPNELIQPTTQQRPQRSDELLKNSEARRADPYDTPPQ